MRICFLNHDLGTTTGAGRFCLSLVEALKNLMPDLEYKILTHDNFLPVNKYKMILALSKLRRIFKDYDIIHALDGWPYGVIAAVASLFLRKKLIITAIGTGAVQPLYSWWKRSILKWAYRKADRVAAVSNNTKKEILKIVPDLKIEVINHGVEFEKFQIPSADWRTKFQKLKPYVLSVGALKKRKGYEYSIQAFAEIVPKFPNLKYVILGDGSDHENLELRIMNYELRDRIVFLENLFEEELIALYQNAELFILLPQDVNKDIEGFGLAFLEAAACGLPAIGSKNSSAEDIICNGKTGFLVSADDVEAAIGAIEDILSNTELRMTMSMEAKKFAQKKSWESVARQYENIYKQ